METEGVEEPTDGGTAPVASPDSPVQPSTLLYHNATPYRSFHIFPPSARKRSGRGRTPVSSTHLWRQSTRDIGVIEHFVYLPAQIWIPSPVSLALAASITLYYTILHIPAHQYSNLKLACNPSSEGNLEEPKVTQVSPGN
ncbi:hypothetical protein FA13DRAFT_714958 [Coprinellus micaceus]|uniref:Uncharacterized protein n=1 Tax=Coprinellus micaceus TaxID=71717 RepID=A0A4Y7TUY1_COPMI|nr:hypothetical protein FA13DRAFT_714958 [Coprinellus micaceus]